MSQGDQDKTEEPTQHRLEQARERGEMARSPELSGVLVMVAFAAVAALTAGWTAEALMGATRRLLALAGSQPVLGAGAAAWIGEAIRPVGQSLLPLVMALLVVGVAGSVLQTGLIFTTHPITPDVQRLNPMRVIKKLFSMRTVWELGKVLVKWLALAGLAWMAWGGVDAMVMAVATSPALALPEHLHHLFVRTSLLVLAVLVVAAIVDLLFMRREHHQQMRMSRRELKDEIKQREGDPEMRSRRKRMQRDMLKKVKAIGRVGDADVVLTNPTHYAVALQYRPARMRAPIVLAKGAGAMAALIRAQASRHGVPMTRDPELARALYREVAIDAPVPEDLYRRLAPVYRWLIGLPRQRILS